jgi:hypothetical protein
MDELTFKKRLEAAMPNIEMQIEGILVGLATESDPYRVAQMIGNLQAMAKFQEAYKYAISNYESNKGLQKDLESLIGEIKEAINKNELRDSKIN